MEAQDDSTYVLDPESPVEMARLIDLDRVTTKAMGGCLVGVSDLPDNAKVLDLACGPGGWVLDVAFELPDIEVAGVDISQTMIDYARARARTQKLLNASFGVMNILHPLDFSDQTFDLVNTRFLVAVLHKDAWGSLLAECTRVIKPGGTLRLTEPVELGGVSTSPAYNRIMWLVTQALWRTGYGFSTDGHMLGVTAVLPQMLRKMGYRNVRCLPHALDFSADSEGWIDMKHNMEAGSVLAPSFLLKVGLATREEEVLPLYQQASFEMLSADFCGMWHFVTVLGEKP